MSRLEQARANLAEHYRLGLMAKLEALSTEREALADGKPDAAMAVRRLAHQLRGSGASFGYPRITEAAAVVEEATKGGLPPAIDDLISVLRQTSGRVPTVEHAFILVIEDDLELARLIERTLKAEDRQILRATTIAEARVHLEKMPVDLVILDLALPDGDGRNLLASLQDQAATADTPVLVLSATSAQQTKAECLTLGAEQYLEKPFAPELICAAVSGILQRRRRHSAEVRVDSLTGLANRAGFREEFGRAIKLSERAGLPLALAILDLDHFKALNDTHGHAAGDDVLHTVGGVLRESLRQTDLPARWGGEEFVVLFQDTSAAVALSVLRKLQDVVRASSYASDEEGKITVTFSGGVVDVATNEPLDESLARADKLLYHAKNIGRDRVLDAVPLAIEAPTSTILIADDDESMAQLIGASLEAEGFAVSHFADGQSALEAALESQPTLVILDKVMPELDGFEVLRRLRTEAEDKTVPVIMLTAVGREDEIERAFDLGADDYVQKPFKPRELVARVRRQLRGAVTMVSSPKNILVIAEDPVGLAVIDRALAKAPEPYAVVTAPDVDAASRRLEAHDVHLALLDVSVGADPRLDALVQFRTRAPGVPVLVLSGVDDEATAIEAVRHGAQDYLVKAHINDAVILRVVRYTLERYRTLSRLRALDDLKSKFVSTVSHEIRTPLAIVREFVSLVHDDVVGETTPEQRECLQSALRNCDRLAVLINDLLDLSRIESGGLTLRRVRTDPGPLLRRVVEDFRPKAAAKNQELFLDTGAESVPVLCDPDRVEQVLVNLLGNAHKFAGEGRKITVRARFDPEFSSIAVEDNGPGIGPDDRRKIFHAFAQVSRDGASDSQGTGLGLTISKNIIDLHGGTIDVASEPGKGSCFTFTLPRYEDGAEFDVFVGDRLRNHDPRQKPASVLVVRCRDESDGGLMALRRFQQCADRTLRSRRDETLLVESKRMLVCLLESDLERSLIVLERIALGLRDVSATPEAFEYLLTEPGIERGRGGRLVPDDEVFRPLASILDYGVRGRILLVGDDPTLQRLTELLLRDNFTGVEVRTSRTCFDESMRNSHFRPDLVVLDLASPDLDDDTGSLSMWATTGMASRVLVVSEHRHRFEQMLELGCDEFLVKPFADEMLLERVRALLPESAMRDDMVNQTR